MVLKPEYFDESAGVWIPLPDRYQPGYYPDGQLRWVESSPPNPSLRRRDTVQLEANNDLVLPDGRVYKKADWQRGKLLSSSFDAIHVSITEKVSTR